jgi:hypothetical protein
MLVPLKLLLYNASFEIQNINVQKSKYMVISRNHNAGQNHNMKIDSKSFKSSNIWEQPQRIETPFMKKWRADWSRAEFFVVQVAIQKHKD